jgi:hypothetical protein
LNACVEAILTLISQNNTLSKTIHRYSKVARWFVFKLTGKKFWT